MNRLWADFNGRFGDLLCLSHDETCRDENGNLVTLKRGMAVTVFDEDMDDAGNRDDIVASGIVEPSPDWLQCEGSRWVLRIDARGVCHESDLKNGTT